MAVTREKEHGQKLVFCEHMYQEVKIVNSKVTIKHLQWGEWGGRWRGVKLLTLGLALHTMKSNLQNSIDYSQAGGGGGVTEGEGGGQTSENSTCPSHHEIVFKTVLMILTFRLF